MNGRDLNGWAVYHNPATNEWVFWRTDQMQGDGWTAVEFDSIWANFTDAAQRCRDLTESVHA